MDLIPHLGARIPHALQPTKQNGDNMVTHSIKTLKTVHIKKNLLKKRQSCYSHEGDIIKTRKKDLVCAMKNLNKAKDINAD